MIRVFSALLGLACLLPLRLTAQVTVEVQFDQDRFLPHETLEAKVRITNFSGQTLELGKGTEWLTFDIQSVDRRLISRLEDPPVEGEFSLDNAMVATKRVNLAPYFQLGTPGHYLVTATVVIPQLRTTVSNSEAGEFDIVSGSKLWDLQFGVPRLGAQGGLFDIRKYALIQVTHSHEMLLYFRLTDASEMDTLAVYPLGRMVSFSKPESQIDRESRLHVLCQSGARSFFYYVITPEGEVQVRQSYHYSNSRPRLAVGRSGTIRVTGGSRVLKADDVNPPLDSAASEKGSNDLPSSDGSSRSEPPTR